VSLDFGTRNVEYFIWYFRDEEQLRQRVKCEDVEIGLHFAIAMYLASSGYVATFWPLDHYKLIDVNKK
jgi:hypothetical protein